MVEARSLKARLSDSATIAPWRFAATLMRIFYNFRIEGIENIPEKGPFIILSGEFSLFGMLATNRLNIQVLLASMARGEENMSYMQEELWTTSYFRGVAERGNLAALTPQGAGRLSLNLLDGYRVLMKGGIVIMNPEGDVSWDGRPVPIRLGAPWLGLHTAVPLVPCLCSTGNYDVWPRWQAAPSGRGEFVVRVGQPVRLCDTPQRRATDVDLAEATARLREAFDRVRYGPGGIEAWAGPALRDGAPLKGPIQVRQPAKPQALQGSEKAAVTLPNTDISALKRGIGQLLWRCPVCCTNDALTHKRPWFRPQMVTCGACGTAWEMSRVMGKDFRLKVVDGPPDLVGLDMALTAWYDEMKRDFEPQPISTSGLELLPGEEVYLEAREVDLRPYQPNPLFEGWTEREAPSAQPPGQRPLGKWPSIDQGRLLLTNQRLVWQGPEQEVDFLWSSMTVMSLWLYNTLGLVYGSAIYRVKLGKEVGLKWLTYAATLAQQVAEREGHTISVSPY